MSEFTADILIVIFVLYFISYLLILKELSYKNALKNENIELDTLVINVIYIGMAQKPYLYTLRELVYILINSVGRLKNRNS